MNKVILMGRLTKDPEVRYSQAAEPIAICRYTLAVNRSFKRDGEPDADFINIVAFGKRGEFASKYFKKGMMVGVVGQMRVSSYEDQAGNKRWSTDVVVDEQHFAESKASYESRATQTAPGTTQAKSTDNNTSPSGFYPVDEDVDQDDLPF